MQRLGAVNCTATTFSKLREREVDWHAFDPCCGNDSSTTVTKTVTVAKKKASRFGLAFS